MTTTACDLLSGTWFAAHMPADVCERLGAIATVVDVPAGAVVVQEGTPCLALGVVVSGRIALRMSVPGDGDRTLVTVDEGDVFGWTALMPGSLATSTGVALVPTSYLSFPRDELVAALASDCALAAAVYPRVLVAVARRLQATRL